MTTMYSPIGAVAKLQRQRIALWFSMDMVLVSAAGFIGMWMWNPNLGVALVASSAFALTWAWGYCSGRSDLVAVTQNPKHRIPDAR